MTTHFNLTDIAIVVTAALAGGLGLSRLKQPPILGYIFIGIILGPSGFAYIANREPVEFLAELGVLLLLFVVGMELSLRSFKKVWVTAILCTLIQLFLSVTITFILSFFFGWGQSLSLLLGFVVALSSTAVVVKTMETLGEIKSDTGQLIIGILIAQDLAIAPMILILKSYGQSWFNFDVLSKLGISVGLIIFLISYLSRRQRVRFPLAKLISGEKELTSLACLALCFLAASISGIFGLSAPYGAFLAGLVLGNTHERLILLESTKPIQSILIMFFFLSIGLLLDLRFIFDHLKSVMLLLFIITIGKTALNVLVLRILRLGWSQSFMVGVMLAQLGEFSFLLSTLSRQTNTISDDGERLIIGLTVLSLTFSPLWLAIARRLKDIADHNADSMINVLKALKLGKCVKVIHCLEKVLSVIFFFKSKKNCNRLSKTEVVKTANSMAENDTSSSS